MSVFWREGSLIVSGDPQFRRFSSVLFLEFAKLGDFADELLAFASRYGPLGLSSGETLEAWRFESSRMRLCLDLWTAILARDTAKARQSVLGLRSNLELRRALGLQAPQPGNKWLEIAKTDALELVNTALAQHSTAQIIYKGPQRLAVEPTGRLLGRLWLALAAHVAAGGRQAKCSRCGAIFTVRRARLKGGPAFCSRTCRQVAYQRRKKAR